MLVVEDAKVAHAHAGHLQGHSIIQNLMCFININVTF